MANVGGEPYSIECRGLSCGYRDHLVLSKIDLTCTSGEVIALLGPNGCGKTTLLKAISAMIPANSGEIIIKGESLSKMTEVRRAQLMAVVPQEESHHFAFNVREVVAMGRLARSDKFFDSAEDLAAADEAMALAECLDLADRPVTELSGGERQRVLIARALAQNAEIMLLDEPTAHMDVGHQLSVAQLFSRLAQSGKSVIAAIHDLNLVTTIATRAVLLNKGTVVADLSAHEMIASPLLDEVYGVQFERFKGVDGRTRVYPVL